MRTALLLCLTCALAAADTVALSDFARQHGLVASRDAVSGRDILKGASTVIVAPGLASALVDGRPVTLARAVRVEDGRTVLAAEDAAKLGGMVRPGSAFPTSVERAPEREAPRPAPPKKPALTSVSKPAAPAPGRFKTIVIDPGHGGVHTGGKGARGTLEKDIVLEVSQILRDRLKAEGIKVVMTRESDRHLAPEVREDLKRRADFTNRVAPDLFLSIHANYAENKGAQGFEVFYPRAGCEGSAGERQAGRRVAEAVRRVFADRFDTPDRGVKEAGFYVIKNAECPAVLVELEFVSNAAGERNLRESSYRKKLADAVAEAVLAEHRR